MEQGKGSGFLINVLRRVLGLPLEEDEVPLGTYLGQVVLALAVGAVEDLLGPGAGPGDGEDPLSGLRAELAHLEGEERGQLLLPVIATGKGKHAPTRYGRLLADAAKGRRGIEEAEDLAALVRCAAAASDLGWERLAGVGAASQLLPGVARHAKWAGPMLLSQWSSRRRATPQGVLLERLRELSGDAVVAMVTETLDACGWLDPEAATGPGTSVPDAGARDVDGGGTVTGSAEDPGEGGAAGG